MYPGPGARGNDVPSVDVEPVDATTLDASEPDASAFDAPEPDGAAPDVSVSDAALNDVPVDVSAISCRDDSACRASGGVCDRVRGHCVECVGPDDCGGSGRSCSGNRCVAAVACTTSRMCPGQVCNSARGYCVDCNVDADCGDGTVCRSNACVQT